MFYTVASQSLKTATTRNKLLAPKVVRVTLVEHVYVQMTINPWTFYPALHPVSLVRNAYEFVVSDVH